MIALESIVSTAAELLTAAAYFATDHAAVIPVITDDGSKDAEIEAALRDPGLCVVLLPVTSVTRVASGKSKVMARAECGVQVLVNPTANAAKLNLNAIAVARHTIATVLAYEGATAQDNYELASEALTLSAFDPGLLEYDLSFTKLVPL